MSDLNGRSGWSPDGSTIYLYGTDDIWAISAEDGSERQMTDLRGRTGEGIGGYASSTDGRYLYFTWEENLGDIWVMDVVRDEGSEN